ncbi:putative transporter SVOPL isoform X1 [Stegostoma tigrinum]|uniref:putative transporter SVOPL isoform X1 n=2 Tax=Stegostoma tigrinum TaxID=3053191 RepID=UPI00202B0A9C|nr:putative transporter SVOPL isoform X1 [Stegostoma tigrinum]XP_048404493.1 putative transporter SVOPL isoform X1 [Stegostoma tigrinum]
MTARKSAVINYIHMDDSCTVSFRKAPSKTYTVEEAVENIGFGRFHVLLVSIMGSTSVAEAMEIMLLAVISPVIRCEWRLEEWQVAMVTTMVFLGFMSCSWVWGYLADRYGRWKILLLVTVWSSYYSGLTSFAHTYGWFVFLRSMVGCGVAGHSQGFIIMTEFMPSKYRGRILPLGQLFWLLGSIIEILLAYLIIPTLGWRWLVRISTVPSIILLVVFKCIPESARYNVSVGNSQFATKTLNYIARMNRSSLPQGSLMESETQIRGRMSDLLGAEFRRTTLQSWFIWLGTAFAYYGLVLTSSELLENNPVCGSEGANKGSDAVNTLETCHCKMFESADYQTMVISTLGEFMFIPFSPFIIESLGRRRSLAATMAASGIFFLLLNICSSRSVLTTLLFVLRALVSANFTIIYIYTAEVYPTTIRSLGLGSCSSMARIGAMIAPFVAQVLLGTWPITALCLFSAVCIICSVLAFTLPIETQGRAMQEINPSTSSV